MTLQRQVLFWVAALAVFILLVWLLRDILLPFVAGMALAYLLDPLVTRIERLGVNRTLATTVMILALIVVVVVLIVLLAPIVANQASSMIDNLPDYSAKLQALIEDRGRPLIAKFTSAGLPNLDIGAIVKSGASAATVFLTGLWSGGQTLVSIVSLCVVTPVVAFYLLLDWRRMTTSIDRLLPREHADTIRGLMHEMDRAIAGFVRGQTSICLILATFYMVAFGLVGLNFGFFIGLTAGIFTFIPYVGSFIALVGATGVAALQFWPDWSWIALVACIGIVGQLAEGYVLSPNLVGQSVGLHPVWLMFALFAFGSLFGFLGLIVAIPLSAAVAVLVRFAIRRYRESDVYLGSGSA
jgi:predicted PurR-regulated permease PerM